MSVQLGHLSINATSKEFLYPFNLQDLSFIPSLWFNSPRAYANASKVRPLERMKILMTT